MTENMEKKSARVLFVDDDSTNLTFDVGFIKRYGIEADTAINGATCIEMLYKFNDYDVIFLDHMMPEMDGIQTFNKIKESSLLRDNTAVVMMTANDNGYSAQDYLDIGFDDYLYKPVNKEKMERIISKYISKDEAAVGNESLNEPHKEDNDIFSRSFNDEELIDVKKAMAFNDDDEDAYEAMCEGFMEFGFDRKLVSDFTEDNWESYVLNVHALRLYSVKIGAAPLAEMAEAVEKIIKNRDFEDATLYHRSLMKLFYRTEKIIKM
ncbi:MAG: response regulator [Butyrivibrio sp.]|nr:response regulator [Butyrivibrio sp.]